MFEKILEKVLLNNVGQFIDGIDKNNLKIGIWSGDIVIQNISVKPEVLEMLDLPVKMKYSFVGKLSVSVPWKSLGSRPVEIILEDVYVILEPVGQESWKGIDYKSVSKRLEIMESFVQSFVAKIAEKQALENKDAKKEDQGMVARLTEKVIDNIQITVRNIHVRFENPLSKRKYAWGITLDEILVHTTNKNWEKEFIDRTDSKNSLEPMRKMLSLKNLGVYWTSNVPELFGNLAPNYIKQNMKDLILKDQMPQNQKMEYIIAISATCRLTQKNKKDPASAALPEFDVSLNLKPLNLQLKKPQLEDVIRLLEFMNDYNRFKFSAMKEREKEVAALSAQEKEKMKEEFRVLFGTIHRNEKVQDLKGEAKVKAALVNEKDVDRFNTLVMSLPDEDLSVAIKDIVRDVERERRTKALEAQKVSQTEKKGWFGWGSKKKEELTSNPSLDSSDIDAIEQYLQETLGGEEEDTVAKLEEIAYQPLFSITFTLEGGNFYLSNMTAQNNEEGVTLSYQGLTAKIDVNSKGQYVNVTLKDYGVSLRTRYAGATTYTDTPIIRRLNHWMPYESSGNMIKLLFEQNPQGKEEGTYINLDSQAVEIVFRPVVIERLVTFFDVSTEDEGLKSKALQQLEKVQDKASQAASEAVQSNAKKEISIKFAAPVLVIPFLQNADVQSECWVLNLGDLLVNTQDEETKLYERYALGLKNLTFQYFPSQSLYMKTTKSMIEKGDLTQFKEEDHEEYKKVFNLIQQFNIDIAVDKMLPGAENKAEAKDKPRMNVDISIPSINLQLNPQMYKNLLRTGEFVNYSKESAMELMENERTKLMAGNSKLGMLYVRETRLKDIVWTKYLCIFKGTYLYFFKAATDQRPAFTYYVRDAEVTQRQDLDRTYAFVLENRRNTGYLAFDDEKHMNEWITILKQKIKEYAAVNTNVFDTAQKEKTTTETPAVTTETVDYNVVTMALVFQIHEVKLALYHKAESKLFDLDTKNFSVRLQQQAGQMEVKLKLQSLDIIDYLIEYRNPSLRKLITSVPTESAEAVDNADLIEIIVKTLDKTHPKYNEVKTDLEVTMKFGYLFVNMKPLTVAETMKFFLSSDQPTPQKVEKVEVKEIKANTQDEIIYTQGTDHTMLKLNVELKEVSLKLIHKKTHVCMAELALKNTSLSVMMKPLSMEVAGVLGNIQLFDTTNYPNTIDSNLEYEKIIPYEMIGVGEESKNLMEVSFKSLDPRNPEADNENKIYSYVDLKISSIQINLLQQPLLRLIDYLSGQLLPSLKPAETPVEEVKKTVVKLEKEVAEKNLANLQFMDMKIFIGTPIIVLKPTPTSTEYLEIRLGNISIDSERIKDTTRFKNPTKPLEFVYCEKFNIRLTDMGMYRVDGESKIEMSRKVNFDLGFERPLLVDEYKLIYSEGEHITKTKFALNDGMKLDGHMSPMILMLQHEDYLMLMRCLNFNIGYDDGMDKMFLSDYEAVVANQGQPGTPMEISLVFDNFALLAFDKKQGLPFAMVDLHLLQIGVQRDAVKNMEIKVTARELNGSYFENENNVSLIEKKMLGALDRVDRFNIDNVPKEKVVEDIVNSLSSYAQQITDLHSSTIANRDQLSVNLQMKSTGDKIIRVALNEMKMYLITGIYLSLLEFISMDDSVNPPPRTPKEVPAITQEVEKPVEKKEEKPTQPEAPQGSLTFSLEIRNILVTMPSTISKTKDTPNVLALKGDISFAFTSYPAPSLDESVDDVKKRNFNKAVEQCAQFNETGRISINLHRLEIFVCEFADLLRTKNFNQVKKRNMILPFSLMLVRKTHMVCNKERTELMPVTRNEINIERLIFRLSYQDVQLINNSLQYQMEQLNKGGEEKKPEEIVEEKAKEEIPALQREDSIDVTKDNSIMDMSVVSVASSDKRDIFEESKEDTSLQGDKNAIMAIKDDANKEMIDNWRANLEEYNVVSKGIQIVIINDAEGSLVPVLEFTMFELLISMMKLPDKLKLAGRVVMNCSYFNPLPSKWEPFVEKFGLNFEFGMEENPKINIVISTTEDFENININVSEQMMNILYSTSMTWKEDYEQKKKITPQGTAAITESEPKSKEEDVIDYVSPYTIINYTGYPIEVSADLTGMPQSTTSKRKGSSAAIKDNYRIENGGKTQYLVESDIDKIFERSMQDMFLHTNKIRVKILHPKFELNPIAGIDIDKPRVKGYSLQGKGLPSSGLSVFSSVKIDKSKKIICLTSPLSIINNVSSPYIVTFESGDQTVDVRLETGDNTAIPLDFISGNVSIQLAESNGKPSQKTPIKSFMGTNLKPQEFQAGTASFVLAKSTKVDPTCEYYEIHLLPPFEIKNCCALDLFYRFSDSKETIYEISTLKPQENLHETKVPSKQPIYLQVRLQGYYWSQKSLVYSPNPNDKLAKEVQIKDATGNPLNLLVFISEDNVGSRKMLLYTKTCIVNETPFDLLCYSMEDKKKVQIPGQLPSDSQEVFNPKITLFNETTSMAFSRRKQKEHSKPINVGTMGSTAAELVNESATTMLDIGVNMSLLRCDKNYNLITKIITISPRFILINKTDYKIEVKRDQSDKVMETLEKDVRTPFYWSDWALTAKDKSIAIRPVEEGKDAETWNWSNGFDIQSVGLYNYLIPSKDKTQAKFFKTSVTLEYSTLFIVIEEEKLEQVPFKIRNECPNTDIFVYQTGVNPGHGTLLKTGQTIPWSWVYPNKKKEVEASFTMEGISNYHSADFKYTFDSLNTVVKSRIPVTKEKKVGVYSTVIVEGSTRVLKFFLPQEIKMEKKTVLVVNESKEQKKEEPKTENIINMNVEVAIKGLGLSIISSLTTNKENKFKTRKEVLYVFVKGLDFRMVDSTQIKSSQVRIKFLQLDNNTSNDTSFPVLWTPTKPKDLEPETKNYFLDTLIVQKVTSEVTFFETIQVLLDASTLRVDGMFIDSIMEVANNFSGIFSSDEYVEGKGTIAQALYSNSNVAQKLENKEYFVTKFDWLNRELSEFAGGNLYIKKLVLNALFFNISFQLKKKDTAEDAFFLLNLLTSVLGTALANLDSAPLTLSGIVLENVFDSKEAITKKIVDKYKDEVTKCIPKLLGSLDIVGNPVGLFTNISSGVVDLVEKPMQGFLQGPLEGGKGIVAGAGSLMKNTVSGTFNSIGKVTGSLASGLSNLTMDDEYMAQREKSKMKRPKHLGEGVVQGVTSVFKGVGEGVTGVFTKPIEGASKGGLKGFFKGAFQGVTGLVVKPVTGVLDLASNTAEGIKNTATVFDQKPNENKIRYPRAFYGRDKYYRTYVDTDAEILWLLHFCEDAQAAQYRNISLLSAYDVFPDEKEKDDFYILVISFEAIIWWRVKSGKIRWAIDTKNIDKVNYFNDGIMIQLKKATEQLKDKNANIKNCDTTANAFIHKKLAEVVEYVKHE